MPRYALKVENTDTTFFIECSYKYLPNNTWELLQYLGEYKIKPDPSTNETEKTIADKAQTIDCDAALVQDFNHQKPIGQYINWPKETG